MSTEEAVTEGLRDPIDENAEATEDAKNLLAELQAEDDKKDLTTKPETNGAATKAEKEIDETQLDDNDKTTDTVKDASPRQRDRKGSFRGRQGGRGGKPKNYRDNIKSDLTTQEKSSDHEAIRKQVEFYFSDSNLPMDKFLLDKVGGSKNNAVELNIIHSFKRMRRFEPFEAIVEALRTSSTLNLTDDDTKVQRKTPLPSSLDNGVDVDAVKVYEDKAMPRSVYVKGFGEEVPSTQFDIEAFFANHGPTNAIRLRRTDQKLFKGSVFVEFETEDLATKFLELDPKPKYKDKDLMIMSKKAYCDQKVEDIKAGKIKPGKDRSYHKRPSRGGRGGFRDRRKRDDEDDRDWRERREEDRKNGFRDDRRRSHRDHKTDDKKKDNEQVNSEVDERGVPVVKTTTESERKAMKEQALAKAKAAVDAENKKREREEEVNTDEPASKKVDVKEST